MSLKPEIFQRCMQQADGLCWRTVSDAALAVSVHKYLQCNADLEKLRSLSFEKMQECKAALEECERIYGDEPS